ncbi:MAG: RluA family pseudouridine synthase [bacterium]
MKKYCFIPDENDENVRLDNYLSDLFTDISRAKIQDEIKNENVFVNGQVKKSAYKLKLGDRVEIELSEAKEDILSPQNIALDIIYEDENMLVINKPSGMLTHPTTVERENTLVNALLYKYGENLSDINGYLRRGILHRLDRNTSGLLMVAKNNEAHEFLANQLKERTATKKYLAIVKGFIKDDFGTINLPIGRHPKQPKMAVVEGSKESITEFRVLKRFKNATCLELDLKTGRTHQIRVHLSYLKHPILNDSLYGGGIFKVKTQEQVLQSYKLIFTKPFSGDIIELEIEPDEKIKRVLVYLENQK